MWPYTRTPSISLTSSLKNLAMSSYAYQFTGTFRLSCSVPLSKVSAVEGTS